MFCRSVSVFMCMSVAVVVAINSDPESITGSYTEVTVYRLTTDNPELFTMEPVPLVKEAVSVELGSLLDTGDDAVVILEAGDTRLMVHRAVLVVRSPVFAAILRNGTLDASNSVVAVPDVEGPVLRQLVAFLYTLQAPHLPSMAPQLLAAADRYGVSALKAACEQQLAAQLSVENVVATAVLAVRHSCNSLRQAAVAFIKAHIFQVLQTKGWIDTMQSQPEDLIKVSQLLSDPPAETSVPPAAAGRTSAPTTSWTPASSAATPTALCHTPPPDDPAVSALRNLSAEEKGRRLRVAGKDGSVAEVQALLAAGADVGSGDAAGWTALHSAAAWGRVEAARCLVAWGAPVGALANGTAEGVWWRWTPLHSAALWGNTAVVRLLLASAADPNATDKNGWTPLHWAAHEGRAKAAEALLQAGANKAATTHEWKTPLDYAIQEKHQQLIDLLK